VNMSDEAWQFIAAAVVTLAQVYMVEPWKFPILAKFWDTVARICGELANMLGLVAVKARANYFSVISETS
jgi:hypothetical protein